MSKILFIDHTGTSREVDADDGFSVMEAAVQNLIPGIDGDCGGASACATCHVHVGSEWLHWLPPMGDLERSMLDMVGDRRPTSRLACQIPMGADLDGIVVHTPADQH